MSDQAPTQRDVKLFEQRRGGVLPPDPAADAPILAWRTAQAAAAAAARTPEARAAAEAERLVAETERLRARLAVVSERAAQALRARPGTG